MYAPVVALMVLVAYTSAMPKSSDDFCEVYSHLNLCKLKEVLEGALQEVQFVLSAQTTIPPQIQAQPMVDKRKSAFVRFGKRSAPAEGEYAMRRRRSLFVPVVEIADDIPYDSVPHKSSYIRFGGR